MKILRLLSTCLVCAFACAAQGEVEPARSSPPGLVVVKLKWERQLEPLGERERPEYDASRTASDTDASNDPGGLLATRRNRPEEGGRVPYVYQYTAEIRNEDARKIAGLIWEYVLSDPGSGKELGRHRFYSLDKIGANEAKKLRGRSRLPPSRTVSAGDLGKGKRPAYDERVEFRCVMYADGTWWRHPSVEESECLEMKDRRKMRERMSSQGR